MKADELGNLIDDLDVLKIEKRANRAGFVTNAQCIVSCLRPLSSPSRLTAQTTAQTETCWTKVALGLLALCRLVELSVPEDVIALVAMKDGGPWDVLQSAWNLRFAECTPIWHRAANAPQAVMDALACFLVFAMRCDDGSAVPRRVAVPKTVAPLRYLAMDAKWQLAWAGDIRIMSGYNVDEVRDPTTHLTISSRLRRQKNS